MINRTININDNDIQEARLWIADCVWGDLEDDEIDSLTASEVLRGISRHYEGGWAQFLADHS